MLVYILSLNVVKRVYIQHLSMSNFKLQTMDYSAVRKAFEGLDESERLIKANKFIRDATERGIPVGHCMKYLQDAGVMSDTEIVHSLTF